ncbi:collagen-like protein, partial [Thiopseudomonas sp. 4R-3cl]
MVLARAEYTISTLFDGENFYRAYADSANGSLRFSETDSNRLYLGTYVGRTKPTHYSQYQWTLVKGSTGVGIKDIQEFYLASPLKEGVTRSTDGWKNEVQVIDSVNKYLWNYEKINYDNNTSHLTEPVIIGTFGSQGIGIKGVTEYYLASPLSEGIKKNTPGWTTEIQPLTPENKYLWNKEIIHYTDDTAALKDKTEVISGTEIFTDKADDNAVVHVEIDGKSYQHAGSGKNLLIGRTENLLISGVNSPSYTFHIKEPIKAGVSYTFSIEGELIENARGWRVWMGPGAHTNLGDFYLSADGVSIKTITLSTQQAEVNDRTFRIYPLANNTSLQTRARIKKIQFEEGSTATAYEPPAPSPNYPIEIHSLNDFDVVSDVGRNLVLNSKRNESANHVKIFDENYRPLLEGRTYTFSFDVKASTNTISNEFYFNPSVRISKRISITTEYQRQFVTFKYVKNDYGGIQVYPHIYPTDKTGLSWTNFKIEEGENATPWTPAPEDITENDNHPLIDKINLLLDEPLRSVGDVKDRLFRDTDELWKIERNVGEDVLDKSSPIWANGTLYDKELTTNRYVTPTRDMQSSTSRTQSSHLARDTGSSLWASERVGHIANRTNQFHLNVPNNTLGIYSSDSTSLRTTKFRNWLQSEYDKGTPVTIQYMLLEPYIETLDQDLQDKLNNLRSFKDSNYVYTVLPDKNNILSENLKPTLHATFKSKAWAGNNAGYPSIIGVYGDSAKLLYLSTTGESMTFNADGTPNPSNQTITLTANLQNVLGNVTFVATAYNGPTVVSNIALSGTGNTRTFNQAQFPASADRIQVRATLGNLVDTVTIVKLRNGGNGQDAIVGYLTNESVTLSANNSGVVSSFTNATGTFKVFEGLTDRTTTSSFKVKSQSGATATISSSGIYTVSAMSADTATVVFEATYNGVKIDQTLSLAKSKEGATGPQGPQGPKGATGSQGPKGDMGTSVSSVTEYYLATSANTGVTTSTSGWTTTIQTMTPTNKYLWNYEKINFSDGTNQPTIPVIIGVYGDKGQTGSTGATGRSITAIQEYYLATSASTGVTRSTAGWTTTAQNTTPTNKYLWNYEKITWSSGTTTTYVEPIIIGIHGEQGPQGPKGATGSQGPKGDMGTSVSSVTEYYLATSANTGVTTST